MKPFLNYLAAVALAVVAVSGCGKRSLDGQYVAESDKSDFLKFTRDGHWTVRSGVAGTYSVDGKIIVLNGPLGLSFSGEISGDTITINSPAMDGSGVVSKRYKKGEAGADSIGESRGTQVPSPTTTPSTTNSKADPDRIACINNLKQIGLAFATWALNNGNQFPFNVPASKGGTLEYCQRNQEGIDSTSARHLQVMSNELSTPKILLCPADKAKQAASGWIGLQAPQISYELRSGQSVSPTNAESILMRCPIHGTVLHCDGSVDARPRANAP